MALLIRRRLLSRTDSDSPWRSSIHPMVVCLTHLVAFKPDKDLLIRVEVLVN